MATLQKIAVVPFTQSMKANDKIKFVNINRVDYDPKKYTIYNPAAKVEPVPHVTVPIPVPTNVPVVPKAA